MVINGAPVTSKSKEKIRVLHVAASTMGGVGLLIYYQMKYMDPDRFEQRLVCGRGAPMDAYFEEAGLPIEYLQFSRSALSLRNLIGFLQLLKLLRQSRFEIVHTHTSVGGLCGRIAARIAGIPLTLWTIHGFASHPGQAAWLQRLFVRIERWLDKFTNHYVAISQAMVDEGVQKRIFSADKATVIHNAINIADRLRTPTKQTRHSRDMRVSPVIGTIARFEPQKGVEHLIRATALVKTFFPNIEVLIAGDGPLCAELEKLRIQLGLERNIRFLGWRDDVQDVLSQIDVFCLPSLWEGFGIVLLEAMAAGKPVVASQVGGVSEVVAAGVTGLLTPVGDSEAMASALVKLLSNPALVDKMGRAAKQHVMEKFSFDRMIARYSNLYSNLFEMICYQ